MNKIRITCTEKRVLLNRNFQFNFDVEYTEYFHLSQQELETLVHDQHVLIISDLNINEKILNNNPNLKLIALCSTGYDHIDINLLKIKKIKLCNVKNYAGDAVAEHALMFMFSLMRNLNLQQKAVFSRDWSYSQQACYLTAPMRELKNKVLTIIGKGHIGSTLAEKAKALGMKVIFSERKNASICRLHYIPFKEAIQAADIISLHCELNKDTYHLIDENVFTLMKKNTVLINLSRGALINDEALIKALDNNTLLGFAADVLNQEPPKINHPLLTYNHPNVILTSHISWTTEEAKERLFLILESNINNNLQGIPQNLIC